MMSQDPSYYVARAIEERRLAMAATDPVVRRIHLELAAEYALRAGTNDDASEQAQEGEQRRA
jgi:hypothetical protein